MYCGDCGHELGSENAPCPGCGRPTHQNVSTPEAELGAEVAVPPSTRWEEAQPRPGTAVDDSRGEELALREADARNALVAKALNHGIFDWNLRTGAVYLDDKCLRMLGLSRQDSNMVCEDFLQRIHPEDRQRIREAAADHIERGAEFSEEYRIRHADGGYRSVVSRAETERDREGKALRMAGIIDDVTERKALEGQLATLAFHDPLTSLPNRTLFMDRLKHALDRSRRQKENPVVMFVDLDDFKDVNDSLGHESGDRALVAVAERLRTCLRPGDTVARLGGDEFTVLLEKAGEAEARRVAERILDKLGTPITIDGRQFLLTPSIGVAFGDPATRPADILRSADAAMYEAKRAGKARYEMFRTSMDAGVPERSDLENDLRRAIEREQFVVHYQPNVLLNSLGVFALEALVRWDHPRRGLIPPDEFLPAAEQTDLILPIDGWVLKEACNQVRAWQEQHPSRPPLKVGVNLSPKHFRQRHLGETVARVLFETGIDPGCLVLEVAEDVLIEDSHAADTTLRLLRELRVNVAVDDFGATHPSLTRLKHWPVDTLKVDRSFVTGLGDNPDADGFVSDTINAASDLGLTVVAEGVETSRQLARLRTLGCTRAQGYYLSKPLPSEAAASLLESQFRG